MVILETAAIGAAGYGLYRGGDAAVRKGKETHKEMKREAVRRGQRSELNSKTKDRKDRIAQLVSLRQGGSSDRNTVGSKSAAESTLSSSSSSIDQRHQDVMAKLKSSREGETKKTPSNRFSKLFNRKK